MSEYSPTTLKHIESLRLEERKKLGQYMTPQSLATVMAEMFTPADPSEPLNILDPAVGTGELLLAYKKTHPTHNTTFHGWDADSSMLTAALTNLPEIRTRQRSLFHPVMPAEEGSVDRIIGNPPYFELRKTDPRLQLLNFDTASEAGRINIYSLFFEYSLKLLRPGGELVFLVPPSMNNGKYFKKLREHILTNSYIKNLQIIRDNNLFADALTSTQIIHLVKNPNSYEENRKRSDKFLFDFNSTNPDHEGDLPTIFTDHKTVLQEAWEGKQSLHMLRFEVKTGSTIWNQHKESFLPDPSSTTAPLIYSKDISKNSTYEPADRLNSRRHLPANMPGLHTEPAIIVNRIVGSLTDPRLRYAYITLPKYYTENHVNVITATAGTKVRLDRIVETIKDSNAVTKYLKALTGNTQLSATELLHMMPFSK